MGELAQRCIRALDAGGEEARSLMFEISELLRKAFVGRGSSSVPQIEQEDVSEAEAVELRRALADYAERESSPSARRRALTILARGGVDDLRERLISELHLVLTAHRVLSADLYQLLVALEDTGATPFAADRSGRGIDEVARNVDDAARFLREEGYVVPM